MSIQIYKPNSKNTGSAYTFSLSLGEKNKAPAFYVSAISQYSWDDTKKTGSFSGNSKNPEKTINFKINEFEAGSLISCISSRYETTFFHAYEGNNATLKVTPWDKSTKVSKYNSSNKSYEEVSQVIPAIGLTLSKGKGNSIKIALEPGEAEVLKSLLSQFIQEYILFKIQEQASYTNSTNKRTNSSSKNTKYDNSSNSTEEESEVEEFEDAPF